MRFSQTSWQALLRQERVWDICHSILGMPAQRRKNERVWELDDYINGGKMRNSQE